MLNVIMPKKIAIEASSFCQLRCPSCPTTSGAIHPAIKNGFLKLNDFRKLIDENPWISDIELSNYGEIFLNPDLLEILKYAYERNITLRAGNGVNLNNVKENVLEGIVKYRLRNVTCSIDGASNETYKLYRIRGNFDTVIENVKKINHFKCKYDSVYPLLLWQFVVFGHNEHEIPVARKLAQELNMDFYLKLTWDDKFSPIRNKEFVQKEIGLGVLTREEYKAKYGIEYMHQICHQLWDRPQINWDGKVLGCCRNFWGDFGGNVFKDGLLFSINNEKMRYARNMLLGKKVAKDDIPCSSCELYLAMKAENKWLKTRSLGFYRRVLQLIRGTVIIFIAGLLKQISRAFQSNK